MTDSLGPDDVTRLTDPTVMRAQTRIGQVIKEKWRLDVLLGVGGMAAVYAATHRNGNRVAIKILHPELSTHHQVRTRFLREGYVANAVGHEGAVRITDDDVTEDGSAFLVMELLDGETLEDRRVRSGGRLDEDEVLSLADQLLDVLVAAHAKGVIHRDLKPDKHLRHAHWAGEAPRLRHRAPARSDLEKHGHGVRSDHGHARVHAPRAGARPLGRGRRPQ